MKFYDSKEKELLIAQLRADVTMKQKRLKEAAQNSMSRSTHRTRLPLSAAADKSKDG
jgi:hypothetical protein